MPFYVILIYINSILSADLFISNTKVLTYNVYILLFWAVFLPIAGYLGDKITEKKLMLYSSILLVIVPVPIMWWFLNEKNLYTLMISRIILSLVSIGIVGPCSAFLARLFPTNERQTGVGFGYFLGAALFGGTAPSLCLYFSTKLNSALFPGFYLSFFGFITVISIYFSRLPKETA
jgi:MHS family proline/betaine transporter-like MFS transporter